MHACNAKLGIKFIAGDELTREYFDILQENLPGIYAEYTILAKLYPEYLKEISIFLSRKIELKFLGIDYERLPFLRGVYDIPNVFIHLSSLLALAQKDPSLMRYIHNLFNSNVNKVKKKLKKDFPDVKKCLNFIVQELSQEKAYESYDTYLKTISRLLEKSFRALKPKYLRISEVVLLFKIGQEFARKIEVGEEPYIPMHGTVEEFGDLLFQLLRARKK